MSKNILSAMQAMEQDQAAMDQAVGMVVINEELLHQVSGGLAWSSGYICTISGECNGGRSCWPRLPYPFEAAQ